jgi:hypothetical protein
VAERLRAERELVRLSLERERAQRTERDRLLSEQEDAAQTARLEAESQRRETEEQITAVLAQKAEVNRTVYQLSEEIRDLKRQFIDLTRQTAPRQRRVRGPARERREPVLQQWAWAYPSGISIDCTARHSDGGIRIAVVFNGGVAAAWVSHAVAMMAEGLVERLGAVNQKSTLYTGRESFSYAIRHGRTTLILCLKDERDFPLAVETLHTSDIRKIGRTAA